MTSTRRRVILGMIVVIVIAALIRLPVWAGANQWMIPMLAISLLILLSNFYVPSRTMPAGQPSLKTAGQGPRLNASSPRRGKEDG